MDTFEELASGFTLIADANKAKEMAAYMRNKFSFFGIQTPRRRASYKPILSALKKVKEVDWDLLTRCWANNHREFQYFVIDALKALHAHLSIKDIPKIEAFARSKQWWDTIDGLTLVIGKIGLRDPRLDDLMVKWSVDDDFWLRRIAIDHQLCRKQKTNTELLETIIINNLGSNEFFINKAIGWSLRDYSRTNPDWVKDFIERHRPDLNRLSIREATKSL